MCAAIHWNAHTPRSAHSENSRTPDDARESRVDAANVRIVFKFLLSEKLFGKLSDFRVAAVR